MSNFNAGSFLYDCDSQCILLVFSSILVIFVGFYFFRLKTKRSSWSAYENGRNNMGASRISKWKLVLFGPPPLEESQIIRLNNLWKFHRELLSETERKTVILHYKTPGVPELSPFRLKLETYLKLTNIPYKANNKRQTSSKGKIPWIEYNGEVVEDSQFCIKYLNEKFNVNLDENLTSEQVAIARAFQVMVEENTFWCLVLSRWVYEKKQPVFDSLSLSRLLTWLVERHQSKQAYYHGLGRHTVDEIRMITKKDLQAISDFLGDKPYLMGDEIHEVDCSVFGLLAQFHWYQKGSYGQTLMHDCFPNLERYCERIKERIWPDLTLIDEKKNS